MKSWEQYTYRVTFSPEDGEYLGLCAELSGLSWLAPTAEAVLRGIQKAAKEAVALLLADGDPVPEPLAARTFSGVFKVRIPPEVHRQLAREAAEQGVSMNRLVSAKLSTGASSLSPLSPRPKLKKPTRPSAPSPDQKGRAATAQPHRKAG